MKELDLLVENYFTPALDATDILRLVEQVMNEEAISPADAFLEFLRNNGYESAEPKRPFKVGTINKITNLGKKKQREDLLTMLGDKGIAFEGGYKRITIGSETYELIEGNPTGVESVTNKGDIAEGILGAGMAAAFIAGGKEIEVEDVKNILRELNKSPNRTHKDTKIAKLMPKEIKRVDGTIDTITCIVMLQKGHFDNLMNENKWGLLDEIFRAVVKYVNDEEVMEATQAIATNGENNKVEIDSDGISNQKGTKIDVSIYVDGEKTSLGRISLKAGSTDTLGQVGGSWEGMSFMFDKMFGIELDSKLKEDWEKAMAEKPKRVLSKIIPLATAIYKDAESKIRKKLNPKGDDAEAELDMLKYIANGMKYQVALEEEGVILIHLKKGDFSVLDFALLEEALIENKIKLTSELILPGTKVKGKEQKNPTIKIIAQPGTTDEKGAKLKKGTLFTVRWRQGDGGKMVKNYVEKKPYMVKLLKDLRKKKRAETLRMRHLQSISSTRHGATHLRENKEIDSNK